MTESDRRKRLTGGLTAITALLTLGMGGTADAQDAEAFAPLPDTKEINEARAELGKKLFFDNRLSGDTSLSCSSCHNPATGWTTDEPLSQGYTNTPHFRNAPSLFNVSHKTYLHWDGRLEGSDLGTASRDGIVEAHFMNADSRLVQERLKQVPEYLQMFQDAYGGEPYGGRIYGALGEFMKTLRTEGAPFQASLDGEESALSEEAKAGRELFEGKAGCVSCHSGPMLSDSKPHALGVPDNDLLESEPERSVTMLRYYSSFGVPNYMNRSEDVGYYAVSKDDADIGKFYTPPLWDVGQTAPYMHSGVFATLEEVVDFYNQGGGDVANKTDLLQPLNLSDDEKSSLVAFLESLTGQTPQIEVPEQPDYSEEAPAKAE
ncbi:cytochrome-c peroxidase [Notoacmeibacter marinus]|uniref:cytochrome-c peroxidase n=1 Tax=Notoacmeibacter marinus TaxID=1876515 RepID=UPI000DF11D84|nr:cytochrome c peroxidase [Notoacmeibacter marinus]